jgi:hypothetical protein
MSDPCVSATVQIAGRPDAVYGLITDLPTLASLAEEAVAGWFRKLAGRATGVTDRVAVNTKNIGLTLQRLKQRAEAG